MTAQCNTWVIVLAGGESRRPEFTRTTSETRAIPTQFCSLRGGPSLFINAVKRACAIASGENVCAVVDALHRQWWEGTLGLLPAGNVIVQPDNRGTANGILLSLLHILERDPQAHIVVLPSDHHVQVESIFTRSLSKAIAKIESGANDMLLLGTEPYAPDTDLDYIQPGIDAGRRTYQVSRFVPKPHLALARTLIEHGALWSTSIVVASGRALLRTFERNYEEIVRVMRSAVRSDQREPTAAALETMRLFEDLPMLDFFGDIIEGQEANLQVVLMLPCGWSDLGASRRSIETLHRLQGADMSSMKPANTDMRAPLSLAAQYALGQANSETSALPFNTPQDHRGNTRAINNVRKHEKFVINDRLDVR